LPPDPRALVAEEWMRAVFEDTPTPVRGARVGPRRTRPPPPRAVPPGAGRASGSGSCVARVADRSRPQLFL